MTCSYKGRWPTTGKFCGWQYFQSQWQDSEEEDTVMPTNKKNPKHGPTTTTAIRAELT